VNLTIITRRRDISCMTDLTPPVPTLAELTLEPAKAVRLSLEALTVLLAQHAALGTVLAAQLAAVMLRPREPQAPGPDKLLTPAEAAALLGVEEAWLKRRARRLPFSRRLSRKCIRFSLRGLERWQAAQGQR
jgi:hypothetical protein